MIDELRIKNYKSVVDLTLKLGRVNVLIGENGSGKSNLLEVLAFASAAANEKLDNEFLVSRGIRVTDPPFMKSAFAKTDEMTPIEIDIGGSGDFFLGRLNVIGDAPYLRWRNNAGFGYSPKQGLEQFFEQVLEAQKSGNTIDPTFTQFLEATNVLKTSRFTELGILQFLIFAPETSYLRTFEREGQILPLGIKGEGLFKLLQVLAADEHRERLVDLKENLKLIDWFKDFRVRSGSTSYEQTLEIGDRYLDSGLAYFDQRSANEGFLFLLFYFALFVSPDTPSFFAIDNIDASLNPKLCSELVKRLGALAVKYNKQVIMTTHSPAILDGLNLHDDDQRLFVVTRTRSGATRARRVTPPQPIGDEPPVKLSEAFLRGLLGGLPKNF